jgi:hypothetical protein
VSLVGAGKGARDVGAQSSVEHGVLSGGLDVAECAEQPACAVGGRAAAQAMGGGAHLDRDIGAVLGSKEGTGLERSVDRFAAGGKCPALVDGLEEPGSGPAQGNIGGTEVSHADVIVEERAPHLDAPADRLPVDFVERASGDAE